MTTYNLTGKLTGKRQNSLKYDFAPWNADVT